MRKLGSLKICSVCPIKFAPWTSPTLNLQIANWRKERKMRKIRDIGMSSINRWTERIPKIPDPRVTSSLVARRSVLREEEIESRSWRRRTRERERERERASVRDRSSWWLKRRGPESLLPSCVDEKFIPSLWIQIEPLRFRVRARARDRRCRARIVDVRNESLLTVRHSKQAFALREQLFRSQSLQGAFPRVPRRLIA